MGAATLIILILFFIGCGVAFYYAVLCFQSRPKKRKQHSNSDRGLLLENDPDLNGNVDEESPIDATDVIPSRPEADPKLDNSFDDSTRENEVDALLLRAAAFQVTPQCAAKDVNPVFIHIEDEPSPNGSESIRHISPVNMSLLPKFSNTSQNEEFLPDFNGSGKLSESFEEDGLMRNIASGTTVSQSQDSERNPSSLPSEGDSYYASSAENPSRKQVHFVTPIIVPQPDSEATIHKESEKLPSDQFVSIVDAPPLVDGVSSANSIENASFNQPPEDPCNLNRNSPPYPITVLHPRNDLDSTDEKPKSDDYVIINPIYEQLRKPHSSDSLSDEELYDGNGPLGWHIPGSLASPLETANVHVENELTVKATPPIVMLTEIAEFEESEEETPIFLPTKNEIEETVKEKPSEILHAENNENKETVKETQSVTLLAENTQGSPSITIKNGGKVKDSCMYDSVEEKSSVVKVLFPSEENLSGSTSPSENLESGTDSSSEPDITEYSFITGPKVPSTALVLADEVSFYSDPKITSIIHIPENSPKLLGLSSFENNAATPLTIEQPPTPVSDKTRSSSAQSDSSNTTRSITDNEDENKSDYEDRMTTNNALNQLCLSRDDCFTITNQNILGTPPTTPPEYKLSSGYIIGNPITEEFSPNTSDTFPAFIDINTHTSSRERLSSNSSIQSSSSSTSSSSTNGSYKIHVKDEKTEGEISPSGTDDKSKIPRLKK